MGTYWIDFKFILCYWYFANSVLREDISLMQETFRGLCGPQWSCVGNHSFMSGIYIVLKHWVPESQWTGRKMTHLSLKSLFPCIEWLLTYRDRARKDGHDKDLSLSKTEQTAKHSAQETETSLQQVGINRVFSPFFLLFLLYFLLLPLSFSSFSSFFLSSPSFLHPFLVCVFPYLYYQ